MSLRKRRYLAVPALGALFAAAMLSPSSASSHREAPLTSQDPVIDGTDVYAFRSPDAPSTVTLIANYIPFEEPAGGPNFYKFGDDVTYRINVNNDLDAGADVAFDFHFRSVTRNSNTFLYNTGRITNLTDSTFNQMQLYSVVYTRNGVSRTLGSDLATPPVNIGPRSTPNYARLAAQAVHTLAGGVKVFAGQRDDPFFVDLGSAFDLLGLRPLNSAHAIPLPTAPGKDGLHGYNVHSIALQVPISMLTRTGTMPKSASDPDAIVGIWSTSYRTKSRVLNGDGTMTPSGNWVQVSRLGNPLVNEVLIPVGKKDHWNATTPENDAQFASYFYNPEPSRLIPVLYPGVKVPAAPRKDIYAIFYTGIPGLTAKSGAQPAEELRLNTMVPVTPASRASRLGLLGGDNQGFPNGRRLGDDVVDIELRALAGGTPFTPAYNHAPNNVLGDGVDSNDLPFLSAFPYLATPWQGYQDVHGS
jgi:hypothetical protein